MKFNDPKVKSEMIAEKYRKEQNQTALEAVENCLNKNLVVELYAGTGGLTSVYKEFFKEIITNDINIKSSAKWHYPANLFIEKVLSGLLLGRKIDLVDFDAYGSPALEIQKFFELRRNVDCPLVLRFSDGLGLWMKRNRNQEVLKKRYLVERDIDMNHVWLRHPELIDSFFQEIGRIYKMKVTKIISIQTKFKNYTLGAYLFKNE
jgi:hypothetical protein